MNEKLQEAITNIKAGNKKAGRQLLVEVLKANPNGKDAESAWLWMSTLVSDPQKKRQCLEKVLELNPESGLAKKGLARLEATAKADERQIPETTVPPQQQATLHVKKKDALSQEISYYKNNDVLITNARALLGAKTFAMANITSVTFATKPANVWPGLLIAIVGLCAGLAALGASATGEGDSGTTLCSGLVFIVGTLIAFTAKPTYIVRIGSASGEADVLSSKDAAYIKTIVDAMNQAIIERG